MDLSPCARATYAESKVKSMQIRRLALYLVGTITYAMARLHVTFFAALDSPSKSAMNWVAPELLAFITILLGETGPCRRTQEQ